MQMAKKTQKGKPAKKAAKPAKKAVAKKPTKKLASKKAPVKKAIAKKPLKKASKPAPKAAAKKAVKKVVAKKAVKKVVAKKTAPKKVAKPLKKSTAQVSKSVAKKPVAKPVSKVVTKPAKKENVKNESAKPVEQVKASSPVVKKAEPVVKKKQREYSLDDEDYRNVEAPLVVEYKTPTIQRPMGPTPKPHINTDTRTRYSDAELKEFKELILKKLEEAQKDYDLLKSTLSHKDDHGTDDTSPTFKLLEDGSDVLSKEETAHLASRQEKFIQNLQNALIRIENKTYGICRATGKLISKERLRSVPHATLAIEAKLDQSNF
jgi:RNA polymerase-binding transcription factor DksA